MSHMISKWAYISHVTSSHTSEKERTFWKVTLYKAYRYLLTYISRWKFLFPSTRNLASMALSLSFPYLFSFYEIYCNTHHEFYAVFRQIY
jgi:hypothetical protein